MKKRSELVFNLLQVPLDATMIVVGFVLAYFIREGQAKPFAHLVSGHNYLTYMVVLLPVWIALFAVLGLYSFGSVRSRFYEIGKIISATAATTMVLIIIDFFTSEPIFPAKSIPIFGFILSTLLVIFARLILNSVQRFLFRFGVGLYKIVLLGSNGVSEQLLSEYQMRYKDFDSTLVNLNLKRANTQDILAKLKNRDIDQLVVTQTNIPEDTLLDITNYCESNNITLKFVPTIANFFASSMVPETIGDVTVLEIRQTPLEGWGRIIKRLLDLFISGVGLVILSPIFLAIALLQKLTNPGPILYLHKRISRAGKPFSIYKFRSMKMEYCTGGKYSGKTDLEVLKTFGDPSLIEEWKRDQKLKKDPRVSKLGRFLRRTSLDELPQLINIFKGDISLVGPRPIIEDELERYGSHAGVFLMIKPGLTGLWQVSGRNDVSYDERVKLDLYYIEHWSLWLDFKIVLQTVWMVLRGQNGY
jgi:exopolysaccharide biosynthesis polyprenyl glycosylphosphotransferase